jgi:hypothetical protein
MGVAATGVPLVAQPLAGINPQRNSLRHGAARVKDAGGFAILSYEYPKRTDESLTPRGMAALRVVGTSGA